MGSFSGKRVIISGGSRGIGLAIAKKLASQGARIAIFAKTVEPRPNLPGTVYTAVEEIESAGGEALPIITDIRSEDQVRAAVSKTVAAFGGIDICINNAGSVSLMPTMQIEMKRFDLMFAVNVRGTFLLSKACVPHLAKGSNAHILNVCPPLDMQAKWFARTLPYSLSKFGMSQCVLGMAAEFRDLGIAVNALWPHSLVATAAISNVVAGTTALPHCRKPEIMADAACAILSRDGGSFSGRFCIDDVLLKEEGVENFGVYRVDSEQELWSDFFVPDDTPQIEPMSFPKIPHK
ncbi:MAG: NAD(P)-dependent oxidoreductase [Pseudomonadota bacterium]|nr:NAD(P)-dependent oxidoreductase [Pseudomonadota bacterium]